jgi:hypothetical protein
MGQQPRRPRISVKKSILVEADACRDVTKQRRVRTL